MHRTTAAGLLAASVMLPIGASAMPMTFDEAVALASDGAPSVQAREVQIAAARSAAITADRLPDPKLNVGIEGFPVTGPNAGSFTRDDFTMVTVGVSQDFPNPAKRRARAQRAAADIAVAEAGELVEVRDVRLETALAWIDLHYGELKLAQLKRLDSALGDLQKTVSARLASGAARPSQALEPEQLRAGVNDRRAEMTAAIAQAHARLSRFTGDPHPDVAGAPPTLEVDDDRLRAAIDDLPDLKMLGAEATAADADVRLARAEKRPDWAVSATYGRRDPSFGDLVSVGVSIDLPLFSRRRQNPKIAASLSEAERARFEIEAGRRKVLASLEADLADHEMHHRRLRNSLDALVPLARQRADLDRASYAAGKLDLGSALLATLAVAEAEVEALNREAEVARDAIRINFTYGKAGS